MSIQKDLAKVEPEKLNITDEEKDFLQSLPARLVLEQGDEGDPTTAVFTITDEDVARLKISFASNSTAFAKTQMLRLLQITRQGDVPMLNAALAMAAAVNAKDELEAGIATQIAASHALSLEMMSKASNAGTVEALTSYSNIATKFQRTMVAQIDALTKLRTGGVQTVKHVHVNEGGQAIVADTFNAGVENGKSIKQPNEPVPGSKAEGCSAVLGQDQAG